QHVGIDDNFFELGGDSISSIQLVARARTAGLMLSARDVFQYKTVAGLASVVEGPEDMVAEAAEAGVGPVELTPIMQWLRGRDGSWNGFHQAVLLQVPGGVEIDHLIAAVQALLDRHDALRMRLGGSAGWELEIRPQRAMAASDCVFRVDIASLSEEALRVVIEEQSRAARERLAPSAETLVQVVWFDAGGREPGRLLIMIHHLAVDGVSWRILLPDLSAAWAAVTDGRTPQLEAGGTSFRRWAKYLVEQASTTEREKELSLWTEILSSNDLPLGDRALDPTRDVLGTSRKVSRTLSVEDTEPLLTSVPTAFHGGVNDVLLTALAVAVAGWHRKRNREASAVLLDLEGHGREEIVDGIDLSRTVGWFTSMFPVRFNLEGLDLNEILAGGQALGAAVKRVKEHLRSLPNNGLGYGLLRYLNPRTSPFLQELEERHQPQIVFNYLGRFTNAGIDDWGIAAEGDALTSQADPSTPVTHCLQINAVTHETTFGPQLSVNWSWPDGLMSQHSVEELADGWLSALKALARLTAHPGAGGFTPSDLSLSSVTQNDIDQLEQQIPVIADILPLSPLQEGMLFHASYDQEGEDVYTAQASLVLEGNVSTSALHRACEALIARHANLRAGFQVLDSGTTVQVIEPHPAVPWREADLRPLSSRERDAEEARLLTDEREQRFDLAQPPLVRFLLVRLADRRYRFVISNHHIVLDGWSMPLLAQELFALYVNGANVSRLPRVAPYSDYLAWLRKQDRTQSQRAWTRALGNLDEPCHLTQLSGSHQVTQPERITIELSRRWTERAEVWTRSRGLTMNTLVQGVWGVLLGSLTGRDDVVFGATVSGRPPEVRGIETMIGLFINTVPVRIRLNFSETPAQLFQRLQDEQAQLLEHQYLGLSEIHRQVGSGGLFDTLTVFENYPLDESIMNSPAEGLSVTAADGRDATHYPLTIVTSIKGDRFNFRFDYNPYLFDEATVEGIARRFVGLLEQVAGDASLTVGQLELLS
ncbi:condensation domain-containing protein, partial [Streptomyces sp. NPDC048215]